MFWLLGVIGGILLGSMLRNILFYLTSAHGWFDVHIINGDNTKKDVQIVKVRFTNGTDLTNKKCVILKKSDLSQD